MNGGNPISSSDARSIQRTGISATAPTTGQVLAIVGGVWTPQSLGTVPGSTTVLDVAQTPVQSPADGNENTLYSFSVPANTLSADKDSLEIIIVGAIPVSAGGLRRVRVKFGATNLFDSIFSINTTSYRQTGEIIRTGAAAQLANVDWTGDQVANSNMTTSTPGETMSGGVTLSITAQVTTGVPTLGDVTISYVIVRRLKAS